MTTLIGSLTDTINHACVKGNNTQKLDLTNRIIVGLELNKVDLRYSDFSGSTLVDCLFSNCDLRDCNFSDSTIINTKIMDCKRTFINFKNAKFENFELNTMLF